jgi:hypothetical protein
MDAIDSSTLGSAEHRVQSAWFTVTAANDAYVGSVYVKKGAVDWCVLALADAGSRVVRRYFNIATGAKGTTVEDANVPDTPQQFDVEDVGGGIYRVAVGMKNNAGSTTMLFQVFSADSDGGRVYAAADTTTAQLYAWGVQMEKSDFSGPTTLQPTSGAAATRAPDSLLYVDAWPADLVNDFVVAFDWTPSVDDQGAILLISAKKDGDENFLVWHDGTSIRAETEIGGSILRTTSALNYVAGTTYTIKARKSSTAGSDSWVDDVKGSGQAGATGDLDVGPDLRVGNQDSTLYQSGSIKNLRIVRGDLTDAQVVAF